MPPSSPVTATRDAPRAEQAPVHDVLVVGGGLVGSSLAIALARLGVDVGLVEATAPGGLPPVFDQRNLSFAEASVHALTALGVMQQLQAPGGPIRRIHVSRQGDFGRVLLDSAQYGRDAFGQVVVARDFGHALEARLAQAESVVRYRPACFETTARAAPEGGEVLRDVVVSDEHGRRMLRARLLVGADGADSAVRHALGIGHARHDYQQALVVCRLQADRPPDGTAYERLGPGGPTALLPRGDRHYGLVLGVPTQEAGAVASMDDTAFLARAQATFGWRAGRFLACGPRSVYPATRTVADAVVGERAVLVGNAAQAIHPLGAQGFNLGLRDAMTLVDLIADARAGTGEADPGHPELLHAYQARRLEDRAATLGFSDGLARVSANPSPLLRPLRSLGLFSADRLPSLQAGLVGGALGYRGHVPSLCRRPG